MPKLSFQILVAGKSNRNDDLVRNFEQACNHQLLPDSFELTIVDLSRNAGLAERHKILATPTIIRLRPLPEKRVIGNLSPEGATKALLFLLEDLNSTQHEKS